MEVKVIGYQKMSFTDENNNKVEGLKMRYAFETRQRDFVGRDTAQIWVSKSCIDESGFIPEPDDIINLDIELSGSKVKLYGYTAVN